MLPVLDENLIRSVAEQKTMLWVAGDRFRGDLVEYSFERWAKFEFASG